MFKLRILVSDAIRAIVFQSPTNVYDLWGGYSDRTLGQQRANYGKTTKSCCSQWFESPSTVDDIVNQTAEPWMMAAKARLFAAYQNA